MTVGPPVGEHALAVVLEGKTKRASRLFRESARQVETGLSGRSEQL